MASVTETLEIFGKRLQSFESCNAGCQVCAQLALEHGEAQDAMLWSQGASLYFDFDDLDDQETNMGGEPEVAISELKPSKTRLVDGLVNLKILAAMTGLEVCKLANTAMSTPIRAIKERVERLEGTKLQMQKLVAVNGQVGQDDDLLADLLCDGPPQLLLVRSLPVWAGLLDEIERGEVELQDLDEGARNDFPLVLAAVRASQGRALEHASWALRGEKAIVLEAVKRNGLALRHAQMTLRADRDVVLTAVRDCPLALEHAAETVRRDRDVVVAALRISVKAAGGLSQELRQDQPFALELLRTFPGAWVYLAKELKDSRDFLLCALQQNGEVLRYAAGWHSDAEAALTAVQKASHAVHYVDSRLRQRGEFARAAVMVNPWAFEQLGSHHRGNLQLALAAARARPALAQFAGESIRNEVVYLIKKEQSEAVGAPQGYVEGPVWWTPEAFKPLVETTGQKAAPRRLEEAKQKYADDERDELARIELLEPKRFEVVRRLLIELKTDDQPMLLRRKQNRETKVAKGSQLSGPLGEKNRDKSIARVTRFQNRPGFLRWQVSNTLAIQFHLDKCPTTFAQAAELFKDHDVARLDMSFAPCTNLVLVTFYDVRVAQQVLKRVKPFGWPAREGMNDFRSVRLSISEFASLPQHDRGFERLKLFKGEVELDAVMKDIVRWPNSDIAGHREVNL
ncbi:Rsbr N terminal [Durusdinium trenchii]|uniref:Rsbr N terminal n=1 Tax=Durusdinium trenchii TaxID=1381693 RepID=A0ABP0HBG7_9DINO